MYIYIYLEPKWPLFWLEKGALFWRVDLSRLYIKNFRSLPDSRNEKFKSFTEVQNFLAVCGAGVVNLVPLVQIQNPYVFFAAKVVEPYIPKNNLARHFVGFCVFSVFGEFVKIVAEFLSVDQ